MVLSTGFASALSDYGALVDLWKGEYLVARVVHPRFSRLDGLLAVFRYAWWRWGRGLRRQEAALEVRRFLHRPKNRERRLEQLRSVVEALCAEFLDWEVSVAGHSYGTDTALRYALEREVERLVLFSPHPPGYLIPLEDYGKIRAARVQVVTGTRDFTRDGVGPSERCLVAEMIAGAELTVLEGVGHMDFALGVVEDPTRFQRQLSAIR